MATLGVVLIIAHSVFLLQAASLLGASVGGFLGATGTVVSALIVFVSWAVYAGLAAYAVALVARVANGRNDKL